MIIWNFSPPGYNFTKKWNFLQLVSKEFACFSRIPISRSICQLLLPCKVRNRAGDSNRYILNSVVWKSSLFILIFVVIHIHIQPYNDVLLLNSRWIADKLIFFIECWIFRWMLNSPLNGFLLLTTECWISSSLWFFFCVLNFCWTLKFKF